MKPTVRMLAGVVATAMLMAAQDGQAQTYVLPEDAARPVITLDYQGGRLRRIDDAPTLSILANGTVVMPRSYAHTRAYEYRISQDELQELLGFIIRENRFFDYDSQIVEAKLSKLKRQPLPVHLSTTVIGVNADNRSKQISCPALGHGPMVEETTRILAIKRRLDRLMSVVKLGGKDELAHWLSIANNYARKELGSRFRSDAPLTSVDLEAGGQRTDGSIYVRFVRRDGAMTTSVTIDVAPDGEPHVTVARDNL